MKPDSTSANKKRSTRTGVALAVIDGDGQPLRFRKLDRPLSPGHKKLIDLLARRAVREFRGDPDPAA